MSLDFNGGINNNKSQLPLDNADFDKQNYQNIDNDNSIFDINSLDRDELGNYKGVYYLEDNLINTDDSVCIANIKHIAQKNSIGSGIQEIDDDETKISKLEKFKEEAEPHYNEDITEIKNNLSTLDKSQAEQEINGLNKALSENKDLIEIFDVQKEADAITPELIDESYNKLVNTLDERGANKISEKKGQIVYDTGVINYHKGSDLSFESDLGNGFNFYVSMEDNSYKGMDSLFLTVTNDETNENSVDTTNASYTKIHNSYSTGSFNYREDLSSTDVFVDGTSVASFSAESIANNTPKEKSDNKIENAEKRTDN